MHRALPHRITVVAIVVMLTGSVVSFGIARRVVDENEQRLLAGRARDVAGLLVSLGSSYEAQMASVAATAQVTNGDPAQFRVAVAAIDESALDATAGGWALLRRALGGFTTVTELGRPTPLEDLPAEWAAGFERAATGTFTVLGFQGEGLGRRFAMAIGRLGVPGDLVVYSETSLTGAAAGSSDAPSTLADLAIAVYVGANPDPDQLLLAFGDLDGRVEEVEVDIAGAPVLLRVAATEPLAGGFATRSPGILLVASLLFCVVVAALIEITLRRRDDALSTVADLEAKNRQLDQALAEQRASEEARAALEAELLQARHLESLGHLAGGVAHDFNNLLAAILSYADLASDGVDDAQTRADLEEIRSAARRGAALTRQLLQFSRQEPVELVPVEVNERVRDLARLLERTLGEDVTLRTSLSDEPTTVVADPHALDQVLLNLVVNARDAVGPGGTIEVVTSRVDARPDHHPDGIDGPYVRVVVRDDGAGMSPDVMARAFEPFFTTKGRGEGTGLGLATVYGIVQRLGGHVSAQSAPGAGTELAVLVPAASSSAASAQLVAAQDDAGGSRAEAGGQVVLVVEDEASVRGALRRMLERAGYQVLDAPDGGSAIELHATAAIDLLLTDLVMPGSFSGLDVAQRLRERHDRLPVLYMTGYGADLLEANGDDGSVLAKPFSEAELLDAVHRALEVT